ncbi:MAG TPA: GTP-binding protein [Burkholderiaceae bacterium]|nr:GTP-binding protein [Burkholderiaceae bacterium]
MSATGADSAPGGMKVTVIGGYLGAGKTTLVNRWLRQAQAQGRRIAVLVNDFGEIGIDADLILAQSDDVLELAGGCVCCSFGSDLMAALLRLAERNPAPAHVLIETSGVALPGAVARSAKLAPGVSLGEVLLAVDALSVIERAKDRYVGDTISRQLGQADRILITRDDLATAERLAQVREWLAGTAPQAQLELAGSGFDPFAVVADQAATRRPARPLAPSGGLVRGRPRRYASMAPPRAEQLFESLSARFDRPVDINDVLRSVLDPALGLERANGILSDAQGQLWVIQLAGGRLSLTAHEYGGRDPHLDRLVCIGLRARFNRDAVLAMFERHGGEPIGQAR